MSNSPEGPSHYSPRMNSIERSRAFERYLHECTNERTLAILPGHIYHARKRCERSQRAWRFQLEPERKRNRDAYDAYDEIINLTNKLQSTSNVPFHFGFFSMCVMVKLKLKKKLCKLR